MTPLTPSRPAFADLQTDIPEVTVSPRFTLQLQADSEVARTQSKLQGTEAALLLDNLALDDYAAQVRRKQRGASNTLDSLDEKIRQQLGDCGAVRGTYRKRRRPIPTTTTRAPMRSTCWRAKAA